jgi:uncharacterized phosphosugar-binding protein
MKNQTRFWVLVVLCVLVWPVAAQTKTELPFVSAMQTATYDWRLEVSALQSAANESAVKLLDGGNLYVADTQKSFQVEVLGRAGGLMMVKTLTDKTALTKNDVILAALDAASDAAAAQKIAQRAEGAGAGVLWFAGPSREALKNIAGARVFPARQFFNLPYDNARGVESISNIIGVWTWMAALVSASVQRGKMPTVYTSNFMPDAMERNAQFRKNPFHETTDVTTASLDNLPQRYLDQVADALYAMHQTQADAFVRGGQVLREAKNGGHQVVVGYLGHMYPYELNAPSQLGWKNAAKYTADATVPAEVQDGDTLLFLGYQWFPYDMASALQTRHIKSVVTSSRPPLDQWKTSEDIVFINPFWNVADAELSLRGYDIDILPISGIMQGVVYWQLAELAQ